MSLTSLHGTLLLFKKLVTWILRDPPSFEEKSKQPKIGYEEQNNMDGYN